MSGSGEERRPEDLRENPPASHPEEEAQEGEEQTAEERS
jgi:hypothetical protein